MLALFSCFLPNIRSWWLLDQGCPGEVGKGGGPGGHLGWVVGTRDTPVHPCGLEGAGEGWGEWIGWAFSPIPEHPWALGSTTLMSGLLRMKSSVQAAPQPLGDGSMCCFGAARLPAIGIEGVSQCPRARQSYGRHSGLPRAL